VPEREKVFGLETEYALAGAADSAALAARTAPSPAHAIVEQVSRSTPCLRSIGNDHDFFTASGFRIYPDAGCHPEVATPEVTDPRALVRYARAGDQMISQAAVACGLILGKHNVDPFNRATWGLHESYQCIRPIWEVRPPLVAHLVTRIIYTGAGGLHPCFPGILFIHSPRAAVRAQRPPPDTSESAELNEDLLLRLFHSRDEPLARRGSHRLQVTIGDSLHGHEPEYLRAGTTRLILHLIDAGVPTAALPKLAKPLRALRQINTDPTCRARVLTTRGDELSAVEIQFAYLDWVESRLGDADLPDWAPTACAMWRGILHALSTGGHAGVRRRLDWAIRLDFFRSAVAAFGMSLDRVEKWNSILRDLRSRAPEAPYHPEPSEVGALLASDSPFAQRMRSATPRLQELGLSWEELPDFLRLRWRLAELDVRFSQLPGGIFETLDREGLLAHRLVSNEEIRTAMVNPPPGRAAVRGREIKRLAAQRVDAAAGWDQVVDYTNRRILRLPSPAMTEARWTSPSGSGLELGEDAEYQHLARQLTREREGHAAAQWFYLTGRIDRAARCLSRIPRLSPREARGPGAEIERLRAWVTARQGRVDEALAILRDVHDRRRLTLTACADYLHVYTFGCLLPPPAAEEWVRRGDAMGRTNRSSPAGQVVVFKEYSAWVLAARGEPAAAKDLFRQAYAIETSGPNESRIRTRILAGLAEMLRRLGDDPAAARLLEEAGAIQQSEGWLGDLAGLTLLCRAKLEESPEAYELICRAKRLQKLNGDPLAKARSLLLQARLGPPRALGGRFRASLLQLKARVPSLGDCPVLDGILEDWAGWTSPPGGSRGGDYFRRL
jgi:tetratricopeptide (TPR) repeat protein